MPAFASCPASKTESKTQSAAAASRASRLNLAGRFALSLLAGSLLAACSGAPDAAKPPMGPLPVTVLEAQPANVPQTLEVMGQTEGLHEAEVRAQVAGVLVRHNYAEGADVKQGQSLFEIDPAPFRIALADARAKAEQAARDMNRLKGLVAQQAVSQKEYDDAVTANTVAQANLQKAELDYKYSQVPAPVSGTSGRAQVFDGSLVSVGTLLTTVVQSNPLRVRFGLGDSDLAPIGGPVKPSAVRGVELVQADGSVLLAKGKLDFTSSQYDTKLGTQQLRAVFDNPKNTVLPGQYVRARLILGDRQGVFLLPQSAVLQGDQGYFVMVAGAENKVEIRPVKPGEWQGTNWVILDGLKAGDQVIVDNLMKLRPGAPTAPHKAGEPPAAPAAPNGPATPAAAPAEKKA